MLHGCFPAVLAATVKGTTRSVPSKKQDSCHCLVGSLAYCGTLSTQLLFLLHARLSPLPPLNIKMQAYLFQVGGQWPQVKRPRIATIAIGIWIPQTNVVFINALQTPIQTAAMTLRAPGLC